MFALTKWYLDLVSDEGIAIVAYAAYLRLGPARITWASVLRSTPGGDVQEKASIRTVSLPRLEGDVLSWQNPALRLAGSWHREQAPIEATLLDEPTGALRWNCVMPRARARVEWDGIAVSGRGYVEMLHLAIAPHRLPFRSLRWGRHLSDRHSVVWIQWDGDSNRRWCWFDGEPRPASTATGAGIALDNGATLGFLESRDLCDRTPATRLGPALPRLGTRLAAWLGGMREHKLLSRSALTAAGESEDLAWAIHEEVTW